MGTASAKYSVECSHVIYHAHLRLQSENLMVKSNHRYPTSTDVARLAGVSQSAVSRTFTRDASISTALREKVLAAASELGYRPNALPGIMQGQRSHMVAIVIGGMYNPFYAQVLDFLTRKLQSKGQQVLLSRVESDHALDGAIDQIARYRVDAVVSALAVITNETAQKFSAARIPVVAFNNHTKASWVNSINSDNVSAGRHAADLFIDKGLSSLGFIHGPQASPAEIERFQGFTQRLIECGMPAPLESTGDYSYSGGQDALRHMWKNKKKPTGIFCANDLMALGAMDILRHELKLSVPEDVSIIGYDNIDISSWLGYRLTSFDQDIESMTSRAVELILNNDLDRDSSIITITPTLIKRESTG